MTLIAYRTFVHKFQRIKLELHVFSVFDIADAGPDGPKAKYLRRFFAIYEKNSKHYSTRYVPTEAAGVGWLREIERMELDAETSAAVDEREYICAEMFVEKALFQARGVCSPGMVEKDVIEEYLVEEKAARTSGFTSKTD